MWSTNCLKLLFAQAQACVRSVLSVERTMHKKRGDMGAFVQLIAQDGTQIPAWVAEPEGKVRGAIVVAQEIFGVNDHIRAVTSRLAARGFVAIAPALFTRIEPDVQLGYDAASMQRGIALKAAAEALPGEGVMQDIRAAAQWAQQRTGGKVGMVGFCWGGLLTWRAANLIDEVAAAVCYYGGGMTVAPEMLRTPHVPVQTHFGKHDAHISVDSVLAFSQAHPQVQVHLYDADHGFNCDQRPSYDDSSAVQAKDRTLAFFDQHLHSAA